MLNADYWLLITNHSLQLHLLLQIGPVAQGHARHAPELLHPFLQVVVGRVAIGSRLACEIVLRVTSAA
jgi:hypothetical protein